MLLSMLLGLTGGGVSTLLGTSTKTLDRVNRDHEVNLPSAQLGLFKNRTQKEAIALAVNAPSNPQARTLVASKFSHPVLLGTAHAFKQRNLCNLLRMRETGGCVMNHNIAKVSPRNLFRPSMASVCLHRHAKTIGHLNAVYCVAFDRTGQRLITGSDDRNVKMWCVRSCFLLCLCRGHTGDITDLAVNQSNTLFASASNDFSIRVWSMKTGLPVNVLYGHQKPVTMVSFCPSLHGGSAWPFMRKNNERVSARDCATMGYDLLVSSSDDGTVKLWNAKDKTVKAITIFNAQNILPDANDPQGGSGIPRPKNFGMNHCAFNSMGDVIAAAGGDTFVHLWQVIGRENKLVRHVLRGHRDEVTHLDFAHGGDRLVSVSMKDGMIKVWGAKRGKGSAGTAPQEWALRLSLQNPARPAEVARTDSGGRRGRGSASVAHEARMVNWSVDDRWIIGAYGKVS